MPGKMRHSNSWSLPPTGKQTTSIARLCMQLRIKEPLEETVSNRWEARRVLYDLIQKRKEVNKQL